MIFITGTDTDIGKTHVSGIIASEVSKLKKTGYMKPVETGGRPDTNKIMKLLDMKDLDGKCIDIDIVNPINFKNPLSPNISAIVENSEYKMDFEKIKESYEYLKTIYEYIVVEGAGGACVPLKKGYYVADIAKMLNIPCVVVARPNLGTINHTVLTTEFLKNRGIEVLGIIINSTCDLKEVPYYEETFKTIEEYSGFKIIGIIEKDDVKLNMDKLLI
ncbi:dethiobiotin synthetase [Methanococcus voltae PS]|uniref:ATP-dependent dethiobiotin synthetase BioD n=1 Tax=Methanococcus voltae PS TaxID=523842 RepID=A0ABT2EUH5_METVO|nr:dethiobiotin synthase [Methanococcus voltae]MCS3921552.1 dethiobiotin synthetase [Methanococcus voltae PS]